MAWRTKLWAAILEIREEITIGHFDQVEVELNLLYDLAGRVRQNSNQRRHMFEDLCVVGFVCQQFIDVATNVHHFKVRVGCVGRLRIHVAAV
jgi:hypothetical protein